MSPQIATPASPLVGYNKVYCKSGGDVFVLNSSGLEQPVASNWMLVSKTGNYTATSADSIILASAGSAFTVTLPTAAGASGQIYTVKKTDVSTNVVTVATTSSQTIDGSATALLPFQNDFISVVSDGTNWQIINSAVTQDVRHLIALNMATGIYANIPRWAAGASAAIATGSLALVPLWMPSGFVVGNLVWGSAGTAGATLTHQWMGLYDSSYVQLAVTADKTNTAVPADTKFTWPIATIASGASSTFTTTYTGTYFIGLMIAATTMPNASGAFGSVNPFMADTPAFGASDSGQTTPPAFPHTAATPTNVTGTARFFYGAATA